MRTTLDIDEDLLAAAKELARRQGATAGQVVSRLLRQSLTGETGPGLPRPPGRRADARKASVAGFQPFAAKPGVVATNDDVNLLRATEGV